MRDRSKSVQALRSLLFGDRLIGKPLGFGPSFEGSSPSLRAMQYGTIELDCGDVLSITNMKLEEGRILMEASLPGPHAKATITTCTVRGTDGLIIGIQQLCAQIPEMDENSGFNLSLGWEFNFPSYEEELNRIIADTKGVADDLEDRVANQRKRK